MNIDGKDLIIEEENIDGRNIEVWFIKSEDEEVRRPTHSAMFFSNGYVAREDGKCLMVQSSSYESQWYNYEGGGVSDANSYETCLFAKSVRKHVEECEKVHCILKSLDIHIYHYDDELNELKGTI